MFLKTRDIKFVVLHIVYWVIAFLIYVFLSFLTIYRYNRYLPVDQKPLLSDYVFWGVMAGLFTGLILGVIDLLLSSKISSKRSFGFIFFLKSVLYIFTLFLGIIISGFIISIQGSTNFFPAIENLLIFNVPTYIFFIIVGIAENFISQINKKFGQGVMLPMSGI